MLEIKRKKLTVKIDGVVYELHRAKVMQLKELSKQTEGVEGIEKTIDFIVQSGLPREVVESLEAEHIGLVMEELTGSKKK